MSAVKFTNDLSLGNRKNGEFLLGYYYRNSPISKQPNYPITNWADLVKYLDTNYPTYIEALGETLKSADSSSLIKAMEKMGKENGTAYPKPYQFANYISNYAGGVSIGSVIADAAEQSAENIAKIGLGSFYAILVVGIVVFGVVLYQKSGGKMPSFKGIKLA